MIGIAAAFIVMTASAGPAQALFGIPRRQETVPQRLSYEMPESVYVQREQLQEFVSFSLGCVRTFWDVLHVLCVLRVGMHGVELSL